MPIEDDPNYADYLQEADDNYKANRFRDSAAMYEHLMELSLKHNDPHKALYFGFRAIDAWQRENNLLRVARIYHDLGRLSFSQALRNSQVVATKTKNKKERIEALRLMASILQVWDPEKRVFAIKDLVKLNLELSEEKDRPLAERRVILSETAEIVKDLGDEDLLNRVKRRLAQIHIEVGQDALQNNGLDTEHVAAREYEIAAKLYQEIGDNKTAKALLKKSKDLLQGT